MTRRPAVKADCQGCREDRFNRGDRQCWSLKSAVVVPMYRGVKDGGLLEKVDLPRCWHAAPFLLAPRAVSEAQAS